MSDEMLPSDEHGLIERNYEKEPVGEAFDAVAAPAIIPRSEWPDRIAEHRRKRRTPMDAHRYHDVPVLNQGNLKYCWAYSVVAGLMNRLAFQGIDPVPHLSATAVAAVGLNFRNQGGHCSKAVAMIQNQGGVPTVDAWPNRALDRALESKESVLQSRAKNGLFSFSDLGKNLDAAISVMLADEPAPCTFSLPWWRHAVLGLEVLDRENAPANSLDRYGIGFVNSYGPGWKSTGYGTFWGKRMLAWEYIGIHAAEARTE